MTQTLTCTICGAPCPPRYSKFCGQRECYRKHEVRRVREYNSRPGVAERKREQDRRRPRRPYDPEIRWQHALRKRHGMLPEDWQAMWDEQDGLCCYCERPLPPERANIHIDHDYSCCPYARSCQNCRRGLACSRCNRTIGYLGDDPGLMRIVADNLERLKHRAATALAAAPRQGTLL